MILNIFIYFLFLISLYKYTPPYAKDFNKSVLNSSNDAWIPLMIFNNISLLSSELVGQISKQILMTNNS